ncbi:hypothetical protein [Bacillus alveayuensis]|uniref:DUF7878 domain-containing protein n=1 Tax=Aeribacillus alveayuensis TaxID=279215 RepID=UPI0005CD5FC2|nr:hypothetical protein [Bacillus alveayuensis]
MDSISNKIEFFYQFTSNESDIPKRLRKDPSTAFRIEGDFKIRINDQLYFEENIALLEFYLYLNKWISKIEKKGTVPEFRYYSLEYDEDEPIISLLPFDKKARINSIWEVQKIYNVFDLNYIVEKLTSLCFQLGEDIERHYNIKLKTFIDKVPLKEY